MVRRVAVILTVAVLAAACSGTDEAAPPSPAPSQPSTSEPSTDQPPDVASADPSWGRALDIDDAPRLAVPTFVLDVDGAVVFLTREGTPQGHLAGWSLDVEASAAWSAPVVTLTDASGPIRTAIVDDGGLHELVDSPTELDAPDGVTWIVRGASVDVTRLGQELASFPFDPDQRPVLSALRDRITVATADGAVLYDPVSDTRTDLPGTCRVTDVHPDVSEVMVCDDVDGRSVATTVEIGAEDAAFASSSDRAVWATVGTTGAEAMVTGRPACGGWGAWDVALDAPASTRITRGDVDAPAAMPLFYTAGGGRWVAFLGVGCEDLDAEPGIYDHDADGVWTRLGAVYPTLVAAVAAVQ